MASLLQVCLYRPDDKTVVEDLDEMAKALDGSEYRLDRHQTVENDNIAMIIVRTEAEALRLMEEKPETAHVPLPSGYWMEVPTH